MPAEPSGSLRTCPQGTNAAAGADRRSPLQIAILVAAAALILAPIWLVRFIPSLDYPDHLASAFVLRHLHDPGYTFSQWYGAQWAVRPYLGMEVALVGLQQVISVSSAGRLLLSICALGLPLAAWWFLREANPGDQSLCLWPLLLAFNRFFILGFVSYELGVVFCFIFLAAWLRWLPQLTAWRWMVLAAVLTMVYLTHLVGFAAAGVVVGCYSLLARLKLRPVLWSWTLFIPGTALYLGFSFRQMEASHATFRSLSDKALGLSFPFAGYSLAVDSLVLGGLAACALALLWHNPELQWNRPWLGVAVVLFALFCITPGDVGPNSEVDRRITLFLAVVALASLRTGRRGRLLLPLLLVLFAVRMVDIVSVFRSDSGRLQTLERSFTSLPRNVAVLPLLEETAGQRFVRSTYLGFPPYLVIERGCFVPGLFARGDIHILRVHSNRYVPPRLGPGGTWVYTTEPDWQKVRYDWDYVWVYDIPRFAAPLLGIGDLVYDSGQVRVYRLRKDQPGGS